MKKSCILGAALLVVAVCLAGIASEEAVAAGENAGVLALSAAVPARDGEDAPEGYRRMEAPKVGAWYVDPSPALSLKTGDVTMVEALEGDSGYSLRLTMKPQVAAQFARLTRRMTGKFIAIIGDGRLYSVPKVIEPIEGPQVIVAARFTKAEAEAYAERFGVELQTVQPNMPVPGWVRDPHHRAAFGLALRNKTDDAIRAYEELIATPGDDPALTFHLRQELGALYVAAGRTDDARRLLTQALDADPPVTNETLGPILSCYHALINIASDRDDVDEARSLLTTALARVRKIHETGGDAELRDNALLQESYLQLKYGDLDAVDALAEQVVASGLEFQGYILQGLLAEIRGDPAKATTLYAMAFRSDPERVEIAKEMINKAAQGGGNVTGLRRPIPSPPAP